MKYAQTLRRKSKVETRIRELNMSNTSIVQWADHFSVFAHHYSLVAEYRAARFYSALPDACVIAFEQRLTFDTFCYKLAWMGFCLGQESTTYGPRAGSGPAKQNHLARSPFTFCSNSMARLVMFYESALLASLYLRRNYKKPHCGINVLYVVLWVIVMDWKSGVNLIKIP